MRSIVCNLIYNNGDEGTFVGFKGLCSIDNIQYNVELDTGRWCSQAQCPCRKFYNKGFKGKTNSYPCNESRVFERWEWTPGNVFATGEPFLIKNCGEDKFAILTTRFRNEPEERRKIIGFFKIAEIVDQHRVVAVRKKSLRLTLDEAKELNFWNYYKNNEGKKPIMWRQNRFRYLEDNQVAAILHDIRDTVQSEETKSLVTDLLQQGLAEYADDRPVVRSGLKEDVRKKVLLQRKYGKGGESKAHKDLKHFIRDNPDEIGINPNDVTPRVEHIFVSRDIVDILFESSNGMSDTVVEIELNDVLPGIHQAIKYRALRCSQRRLSLTDKKVRAVVVAWTFTKAEKELCRLYGIDFYEKKLD